jgi:hypothetical protein
MMHSASQDQAATAILVRSGNRNARATGNLGKGLPWNHIRFINNQFKR